VPSGPTRLRIRRAVSTANRRLPVQPRFMDDVRNADTNRVASEVETWLLGWLSERAELPLSSMEPTVSFTAGGRFSHSRRTEPRVRTSSRLAPAPGRGLGLPDTRVVISWPSN